MPEITRFFGIRITMYYDEHNPPHFHAWYAGYEAEIDFDGNIISGSIPTKQLKLIQAWATLHYDELVLDWEDCRVNLVPHKIQPLA